jgi:hypothetical protein
LKHTVAHAKTQRRKGAKVGCLDQILIPLGVFAAWREIPCLTQSSPFSEKVNALISFWLCLFYLCLSVSIRGLTEPLSRSYSEGTEANKDNEMKFTGKSLPQVSTLELTVQ